MKKIIIPNLERQIDRRYAMFGMLIALGVTEHMIEFVPAYDAQQYATDPPEEGRHNVIEAMNKAGIEYPRIAPGRTVSALVWHWTWLTILKSIMELPENTLDKSRWWGHRQSVLVLIDDCFLRKSWAQIRGLEDICWDAYWKKRELGEPRIIQLLPYDYDKALIERQPLVTGHEMVHGLRGHGDPATILTADGAKILYDMMIADPWRDPEHHMRMLAEQEDQTGFYSVNSMNYAAELMEFHSNDPVFKSKRRYKDD